MIVFVDTSAFIALADTTDQYHQKAKSFVLGLTKAQKFCTTNYIIDETVTRLRKTAGFKPALHFGETIFTSEIYHIYYVDSVLEKAAFETFKKFRDKDLSFTDCVSFALMKRLGITQAFAFDEDFVEAGFETLPY